MMLPSHLLGTVVLALLLGLLRGRPFRREEWALALAFGVVIDLDHLLAFPSYVLAHGAASLDPAVGFDYGSAWQGFMHTPWALLAVVPAMLWWRSAWPAVFWLLHMWQDFVIARHYVTFGGPLEWLVVGMLAGTAWLLVVIQRAVHRARHEARYRSPADVSGIR